MRRFSWSQEPRLSPRLYVQSWFVVLGSSKLWKISEVLRFLRTAENMFLFCFKVQSSTCTARGAAKSKVDVKIYIVQNLITQYKLMYFRLRYQKQTWSSLYVWHPLSPQICSPKQTRNNVHKTLQIQIKTKRGRHLGVPRIYIYIHIIIHMYIYRFFGWSFGSRAGHPNATPDSDGNIHLPGCTSKPTEL